MGNKESALKKVWDGDKLIGLFISCESATDPAPTQFEKEIVRIFNHRQPDKELVEFARKVIKEVCWGYPELDGCEIQDLAEKLNLIEPHIATKDDVDEETDFEIGDRIYQFSDMLKEQG